jgi:dGTP triphosphohydrolase
MALFPCIHISIDAQGGGVAVIESLHDIDKLKEGELPLWPTIDDEKPKDTDGERGLHIIEPCQFARYEWLSEANHGLRKDFEDKVLLFPQFDPISLSVSNIEDSVKHRMFDTLEECVMDIEELKDELSMIQMTQTNSSRDRWDTPEVIVGTGKKSKMRKDRYSALLMANMAARTLQRTPTQEAYNFYGGFANGGHSPKNTDEKMYVGPNWFTENMKDVY